MELTYYRLSQVDYNKSTTVFKAIDINCKTNSIDQMILFPNPTSNSLNLKYNDDVIIKKVIITDLTGKTIIESFEKNLTQINVENLSNGVYLLQAFSEDKKYQSKFIKK